MVIHRISSFRGLGSASLLLAAVASAASAQTQAPALPAGPMTLEQVLEIAESRSETVAIARQGIRRAEGEEIRARADLYPQLSASFGYDRALASEFEGVFDNFGGGGDDGGGDDGLEDLPFGRKNTWRASVAFSQNIYSGGRIGAQRALARAGSEVAGIALTTTRAQLLFDVTQAYYDAALSERLVAIAEATLEQAGATLKQTQAGFDAGTQPEFEVLRARVTRDNQTPLVIRQRVNRDVALMRLKQLLELPADYDLRLAAVLGDETLPPPPAFAPQVAAIESAVAANWISVSQQANTSLPQRAAVIEAATGVVQREASLRLIESQKMPTVAVNSTLTRLAYPSDFFPTFDRMNWSVGASVNVPILTGGRQRGDEQVARAELEQARIQRQQVEELAALDTRSAWAELLAAKTAWEASSGTIEQATRAYQIAEVRYSSGVSTQLELTDSRLLLQQAEANRAQAARDLQVARARAALLPNLPIGGATTGAAPRTPQPQPAPQPQPPPQDGGQIRNASTQGSQTQGTR